MRRAPGGVANELKTGPTLAVEARLMQTAKKAGVPEPEIVHVLEPEDELGEGVGLRRAVRHREDRGGTRHR